MKVDALQKLPAKMCFAAPKNLICVPVKKNLQQQKILKQIFFECKVRKTGYKCVKLHSQEYNVLQTRNPFICVYFFLSTF